MAVTYKEITYEEAINLVMPRIIEKGDVYAKAASDYFDTYGYTPETIAYVFEGEMPDVSSVIARDGKVSMRITTPTVSATTTPSPLNSNTSKTVASTMTPVLDTVTDSATGKMTLKQAASGAFKFFTGTVTPAIWAASVGISLGKTIDKTLYTVLPHFFEGDFSSLNPDTWASITSGDDSLGADIFNMVFGIDDSGNTQAYISEDAYAYMAQWLAEQNFFSSVPELVPDVTVSKYKVGDTVNAMPWVTTLGYIRDNFTGFSDRMKPLFDALINYIGEDAYGVLWYIDTGTPEIRLVPASSVFNPATRTITKINSSSNSITVSECSSILPSSVKCREISSTNRGVQDNIITADILYNYYNYQRTFFVGDNINAAFSNLVFETLYFGNNELVFNSIQGTGSQAGATLPNTDDWNNQQNTIESLRRQYPDLFNNAVPITTLQPDGTTTTTKYIPVPMPNATSATDTQPTSATDTQSQTQTQVNTQTLEAIKQLISELIATPTDNPPDTGDGSSPDIVPVVGSSSGLWAIYHPTKAQIDSFGQWLWSDGLIDQIKALMFSPIDAVISLHKVYCQPIDAGTSTIQVGYLNSNVSSAYVEQTHVYTSCGSVSLQEYFGNVFDYSPHTSVHLYLPFVGIVPLDVESVMRSTIYVKYGVDILTGDCLASVVIMRDGNSSVQYEYSGNAAEHFPLTAGNFMGLVSGAMGAIASGVASVVSTGLPAVGAVRGALSAAHSMRANVARSGSLSGNAGAMGGKTPYLIIERPQTKVADNFEHYQGYPTNAFVRVGECNGYIRASRVHVEPVPATDKELDMIRNAFMSGVIV